MAVSGFLHGIEVTEINSGPVPIQIILSAVVGIVGSAPSFAVPGAIPMWDPSWLVQVGQQCLDANANIQAVTAITLPVWQQNTAYVVGNLIVDANGNTQRCTTAGSSGGGSHPAWSNTLHTPTSDGTGGLMWTMVAFGKAAITGVNSPSWTTTLNATTTDTIGASTGSVTWTLLIFDPPPLVQVPTLISGANFSSGLSGQAGSMGPMIQGYTIPYALNQIFAQGAGQAIVVNVFDQVIHNSPINGVTYNFPSTGTQAINLGQMGLGNVKVTNVGATVVYVEGADFALDVVNGVITSMAGGLLANGQAVVVTCVYADPSKLADSDLVGTVSSGVSTGMQAWKLSYGLFGFFPKILIAPSYGTYVPTGQTVSSQDSAVAAGMASVAASIRAIYLLDCSPGSTPTTMLANRGTTGAAWDTSDKRALLCGPQELFNDLGIMPTGITLNFAGVPIQNAANTVHAGPYSPWVAGGLSARDAQNGYWWSPSNMQVIGPLGPDVQVYASFLDAASDTNNLNAAGIVTALTGFATGIRIWGNRSAGFPTYTTPDVFISIRRTMDVIEQSLLQSMLQFLDQPISSALITAILASCNSFVRTLIQRGALVGGSASYNPAENPPSEIAAGHLTFDLDVMPPPPLERLTFNVFIDTTLLSQLNTTNALNTTASAALGITTATVGV